MLWVGCGPATEPVPEDLEGLLHHLWQVRESASDATLHAALVNLDAAVGGGVPESPLAGRTDPLTAEEQAVAVLDHPVTPDPQRAPGMTLVSPFPCHLQIAADILTTADQAEIYGEFESYQRTHLDDIDAWLAHDQDQTRWEVDYAITIPFDLTVAAHLRGGARWVPDLGDPALSPHGAFFLVWANLTEPGEMLSGEGDFAQDYRVEVYYTPEPGMVVHVEALWRQMQVGLVDTDNDAILGLILDAIIDLDETTGEICADWGG